jgi:hypothetical protein
MKATNIPAVTFMLYPVDGRKGENKDVPFPFKEKISEVLDNVLAYTSLART